MGVSMIDANCSRYMVDIIHGIVSVPWNQILFAKGKLEIDENGHSRRQKPET